MLTSERSARTCQYPRGAPVWGHLPLVKSFHADCSLQHCLHLPLVTWAAAFHASFPAVLLRDTLNEGPRRPVHGRRGRPSSPGWVPSRPWVAEDHRTRHGRGPMHHGRASPPNPDKPSDAQRSDSGRISARCLGKPCRTSTKRMIRSGCRLVLQILQPGRIPSPVY